MTTDNTALDDCQNAFEKWYSNNFLNKHLIKKHADGFYVFNSTLQAFQAWQAALSQPQPSGDASQNDIFALITDVMDSMKIGVCNPHLTGKGLLKENERRLYNEAIKTFAEKLQAALSQAQTVDWGKVEKTITEIDDSFRGGIMWAVEAQTRQGVLDRLVEVCERIIPLRDKALEEIRVKK